jgi:hypothetical protein
MTKNQSDAGRDLRDRDHPLNALRHGVLSRYTVLPWEHADEYQDHAPQGPTEEHLVEEIARHHVAQASAPPGRGRRPPAAARQNAGGPIAKRSRQPLSISTPPASPNAWSMRSAPARLILRTTRRMWRPTKP